MHLHRLTDAAAEGLGNLKQTVEDKLLLADSYRAIFSGKDGERVLRHLMKECGILSPKITTDTNMLLIRQGQQQIVLSILRIIGKDNQSIIEQIEESLNENS